MKGSNVCPDILQVDTLRRSVSALAEPHASCQSFRVEVIYLGSLWRSLQDERTDTLLVAVVVHNYERVRQPRRCEETRKLFDRYATTKICFTRDPVFIGLHVNTAGNKSCIYWRRWADRCSLAGVGPERWAGPEPWRCTPPSAADPAPGSAAVSESSAQNWWTSAQKTRAKSLTFHHEPRWERGQSKRQTFLFLFIFVISRNSSNRNR